MLSAPLIWYVSGHRVIVQGRLQTPIRLLKGWAAHYLYWLKKRIHFLLKVSPSAESSLRSKWQEKSLTKRLIFLLHSEFYILQKRRYFLLKICIKS